jgi:endogenous inhibitor of DNA gyrase (YacG/DUF329 family)
MSEDNLVQCPNCLRQVPEEDIRTSYLYGSTCCKFCEVGDQW